MLYRKHRESVDGKWHFNRQCRSWPRENFLDMAVPEVDEHELLCSECVRLRSRKELSSGFVFTGEEPSYIAHNAVARLEQWAEAERQPVRSNLPEKPKNG